MPPVLLMTRPAPASAAFADRLPKGMMRLCISPLIRIAPCDGDLEIGNARGLILTSANGVEIASGRLTARDLPCYCVGRATTRAATQAGWTAHCVGESANDLVQSLTKTPVEGPLLHLSGVHTRGDIADRLTKAGLPTTALAIYDQVAAPLNAEAVALLNGTDPVVIPVFSPRTAEGLAGQAPFAAPLHLIALSQAVAAPLDGISARERVICARPDADHMGREVENCLIRLTRVESTGAAQ